MEKLSITCPKCGKLNTLNTKKCVNCGYPLNAGTTQLHSRWEKTSHNKLIGAGLIFALLVLVGTGIMMVTNKDYNYGYQVLGTQRIKFFNRERHHLKTYYVVGHSVKSNPQLGRVVIFKDKPTADELAMANGRQPQYRYYDNEKHHTFSIVDKNNHPMIELHYEMRLGIPMLRGTCQVAGHPEYQRYELGTIYK